MVSDRWMSVAMEGLALGAILGSVWYASSKMEEIFDPSRFTKKSFSEKDKKNQKNLDKKKLLDILKEITYDFHKILTEFANTAMNILDTMKEKGLASEDSPVAQQQLAMLFGQQGVAARLSIAEAKVLDKYFREEYELSALIDTYQQQSNTDPLEDQEICLYTDGIKRIYRESVAGKLPLLPGGPVPPPFEQEVILDIISKINASKQKKFAKILAKEEDNMYDTELSTKLQKAVSDAESEILKNYDDMHPRVLAHAVAFYFAFPDFKTKKRALDEDHSKKILSLMSRTSDGKEGQYENAADSPETDSFVVASIHEKLEKTTGADLEIRLESCSSSKTYLICQVLRSEICHADESGEKKEEEAADASATKTKCDKKKGALYLRALDQFSEAIALMDNEDITYVWMPSDEAEDIQTHAIQDARKEALKAGAAYILYHGDVVKETSTDLDVIINAAKKLVEAGKRESETFLS